jgi:GNAT superfamily N-acetyltransferase
MLRTHGDYLISTDADLLDLDLIRHFLAEESYWARGIPRAVVETSIRHSLCFGVHHRAHHVGSARMVGFARVVTDYATFGYLADVFIVAEHRGRGLAKQLMECIMTHPELQGFRRWQLATRDAHGLYAQFGFGPLANPDWQMEIRDRDVYQRSDGA